MLNRRGLFFVVASASFISSFSAVAEQCSKVAQKVTGTVYCDNQFKLWVNGQLVTSDPISFTPHQAVQVSFDWDGESAITYAIQCEDYASKSGYEYTETWSPQLGDGALIASFNDPFKTTTNKEWKVYTVTYGPTDKSIKNGCDAGNLEACIVEDRGTPEAWVKPEFDDSHWQNATEYSIAQAGWGRKPSWSEAKGCCTLTSPLDRSSIGCDKSVTENACLDPRRQFNDSKAQFIWAQDLERDNRVLFRYSTRCEE